MTEKRKLSMEELHRLTTDQYKNTEKLPVTVILDNVRSLNNIGSIFRTSDALLIERIILTGISATPPHNEIHKTALGAEDSVEWSYYEDTKEAVQLVADEGYTICSIEQVTGSVSLTDFKPEKSRKYALVFGNEVKGVQQSIVDMSDVCIEIPQFGTKHSFNVSVTAGIVLWEFFKHLK
jgi:tRNA G18 (ribose-2'-O)-methylase SpoU